MKRLAKQCAKAKLSVEERRCAFEATDKGTVAWCAPRFMPDAAVAMVTRDVCSAIVVRGAPAQVAALRDSCVQDRRVEQRIATAR